MLYKLFSVFFDKKMTSKDDKKKSAEPRTSSYYSANIFRVNQFIDFYYEKTRKISLISSCRNNKSMSSGILARMDIDIGNRAKFSQLQRENKSSRTRFGRTASAKLDFSHWPWSPQAVKVRTRQRRFPQTFFPQEAKVFRNFEGAHCHEFHWEKAVHAPRFSTSFPARKTRPEKEKIQWKKTGIHWGIEQEELQKMTDFRDSKRAPTHQKLGNFSWITAERSAQLPVICKKFSEFSAAHWKAQRRSPASFEQRVRPPPGIFPMYPLQSDLLFLLSFGFPDSLTAVFSTTRNLLLHQKHLSDIFLGLS